MGVAFDYLYHLNIYPSFGRYPTFVYEHWLTLPEDTHDVFWLRPNWICYAEYVSLPGLCSRHHTTHSADYTRLKSHIDTSWTERRNDDNLELADARWSLMEFFFLLAFHLRRRFRNRTYHSRLALSNKAQVGGDRTPLWSGLICVRLKSSVAGDRFQQGSHLFGQRLLRAKHCFLTTARLHVVNNTSLDCDRL